MIALLAITVAVLLGLMIFQEDESPDSDAPVVSQPRVTPPPAAAVPVGSPIASPAFPADGCWPDGARVDTVGYPQWETAPEMVIDPEEQYLAVISTNKGRMTFELDTEAAPMAVNNFICLAASDYYDMVPFHRVIEGFMVQSGDPTGTGTGGPGYRFEEELPGDDLSYERGTLAMARTQDPGSQGSQFFIVHQDLTDEQLAKNYTIFGHMIDGQAVLDDIADSRVIPGASGEQSYPAEFLVIRNITIQEAPES